MSQGRKVVTPQEMQRIENQGLAAGHDPRYWMECAAEGIAQFTEKFVLENHLPPRVLLLTGKGNNAADAFTTGSLLIAKGFYVKAVHLFSLDDCSPLCREKLRLFIQAGGEIELLSECEPSNYSCMIDGLVGIGFRGKAEGALAKAIEWAHHTMLPIFSIDIPSGLDSSTGEVGSCAIRATATLYLQLPKIGFFIGAGWDHVGDLIPIPLSLPSELIQGAQEEAVLLDETSLVLPRMRRGRHKYEAGYVLGIAGSASMPGAAALASTAALRSGAGIVRLFSPPSHLFPAEIIREEVATARIEHEAKRAAAYFIGPGLGRESQVESLLEHLLPSVTLPSVLDADLLYFLGKNSDWKIPPHAILTPHQGEMEVLLRRKPSLEECQKYALEHQTTVVLKGAPTMIFHPSKKPLIISQGDPGMATAGSGDILTGLLAGLLAQKMVPHEAAALGVYLHAVAGEKAAIQQTSYCLIASDILSYLPDAFLSLQER